MLYRKTLPHHGRTFYGSLQLSRLFQKMHALGRQVFPCVPRFSAWGVRERVLSLTPGIPFDRNLFAALGMIPGAILCALLLLLPCGGWPSWLFHTLLCAVIAPIFCYFRGMNIDIFPAAVWGALLGASISYPLFTFFNTLKDRAEKDSGKDSQRPVSDEMSAPKK